MLRVCSQRCRTLRCVKLIRDWRAISNDPSSASKSPTTAPDAQRRANSLGIQMLSKSLHKQIYGNRRPRCSKKGISLSQSHLTEQGLWGKEGSIQPDLDLQLPPLQGENIDEHFRSIADELGQPYLHLALELSSVGSPAMPQQWCMRAGWTRYSVDGDFEAVECPSERALVFDVEVCVKESPRPVLAVAMSKDHWYSWVSEQLVSGESFFATMERESFFFAAVESSATLNELIPMESVKNQEDGPSERLIVGHNVSYDRARIREQYFIENSKTKFLDTLSLHTCVSGQTTHQKVLWQAWQKNQENWEPWMDVSSPNSLANVHWCHVTRGGRRVSKEQRSVFVKGTIQDVRNDFQACMQYCARDVLYTHEVLQKLLPQLLERFPHPVTFAGMLEMGTAYLPVNHSWEQYIDDAEYTYEEMEREMKSKLMALADEACAYSHNDKYLEDPWLCNLDWSIKFFRGKAIKNKEAMKQLLTRVEERVNRDNSNDESEERFEFLISSTESTLPSRQVHMPGYPVWYRDLCMKRSDPAWQPGAVKVSAQTRVTPYLLRMKWKGHPLYYHSQLGWGYVISTEADSNKDSFSHWEDTQSSPDVEFSLEEMMETHYREMEEIDREEFFVKMSYDNANVVSDEAPRSHDPVTTTEHVQSEDDEDEIEWKRKRVRTKWGTTDDIITRENGSSCYFFKIPHKDGANANCGNPLSKDYLPKMEDGTLTSGAGDTGKRILTLNSMMSFWRSARSRIMQQFVVWLNDSDCTSNQSLPQKARGLVSSGKLGAIIPQVIVAGTATRRGVEPTWLTASNAKPNRVGSEQKAMIQAPPGYHLVGADVDSQELWIAALLGDVHFAGIHGCTAIGWMTLQGKKSEQTDVHSNTAKTIGISRDHAKILNYGRFYGAGKRFIELLLRKFNPSLSAKEVEDKAKLLYSSTKGVRMYKLTKKGQTLASKLDLSLVDGCLLSQSDWKILCGVHGYYSAKKVLSSRVWWGGSESHLFNKLESIALSDHPTTPVLGCSLTRALEKQYVGNEFQLSRVNWVVQSSAVDYLHLLLVSCQWMFKRFNISGRFCISIHDEVRYLVKSEDRYRVALALQYANLFTRAMFAYKLGLQDLPMSVAFFSGVDIDTVLRKEVTMDCRTPSNPLGLEKGYVVPNGEVLDIYELVEKTNGLFETTGK